MSKTLFRSTLSKIVTLVMVMALVVLSVPHSVGAAAITGRKVVIGSSALSASTNYTFSFTVPTTGTVIKSFDAQVCDTASGTCTQATTAAGFSSASTGTLPSQPTGLGAASGWTSSVAANKLRILNASNATTPSGSQSIAFQSVGNPTTTSGTFFLRMTTYSDSAWTTPIDTGTVAASTANQVTVTASVDEALAFTVSGTSVSLGTVTAATTGKDGTISMTASTNAGSGYAITYTGSTLTSGSNTIAAYSNAASVAGTAGFGFNLVANTVPSVGTAPSGAGSGTVSSSPQYNTANAFRFASGEQIASAAGLTNSNTYTVSYVANVAGSTPAGAYTSTISYVATPNY